MTRTPHPLGRLLHHDSRSLAFTAPAAPALRNVTHRLYGPVLDQGRLGSCTGNAMAHALNTTPLRHGRPLLTEVDAVRLYSTATTLDPFDGQYPPTDTGSSGLSVAKAALNEGLIGGYDHAFGIDACLAALVLSPVMVGTEWDAPMFTPDPDGYLHPDGNPVGGHEYLLIGLSVRKQRVTMLNNWSDQWGIRGRAYLSFDDLDALLKRDGDVTVPRLTPND